MARTESAEEWVFTTKVLTDRINELAIQLELAPEDSADSGEKKSYTNATRVGRLLGKLRFERPDSRDSSARGWKTRKADIEKLCAVEQEGVHGVICGRALYNGALDFTAAQKRVDELNGG